MEKSMLLMLLVFSGLNILPSCLSFQYKFVNEEKNWYDAQKYCRENYTDLATIYDDATILSQTDKAWIGLYQGLWTWSLNGEVLPCQGEREDYDYTQCSLKQRSVEKDKLCVNLKRNGNWIFDVSSCSEKKYFVCYDGRNHSNPYICISEEKTWNESQSYCRENHTDLASVRNATEKDLIRNLCQSKSDVGAWIGLSRSENWQWSDQYIYSFKNWDEKEPNGFAHGQGKLHGMCVESKTNRRWNDNECLQIYKKPFICYDDDLVLVQQNKTWVEALDHCRDRGWDLVSVHFARVQHWVQRRARNATTPYVWLGLRYNCALKFWLWVSEHGLCYQNWAQGHGGSQEECEKVGAMPREGPQKWEGKNQTEKFNFICTTKPDDY